MSYDRCSECDLSRVDCRCIHAPRWLSDKPVRVEWRSLTSSVRGLECVAPGPEAVALRDRLNRLYEGKVHHFLTTLEHTP